MRALLSPRVAAGTVILGLAAGRARRRGEPGRQGHRRRRAARRRARRLRRGDRGVRSGTAYLLGAGAGAVAGGVGGYFIEQAVTTAAFRPTCSRAASRSSFPRIVVDARRRRAISRAKARARTSPVRTSRRPIRASPAEARSSAQSRSHGAHAATPRPGTTPAPPSPHPRRPPPVAAVAARPRVTRRRSRRSSISGTAAFAVGRSRPRGSPRLLGDARRRRSASTAAGSEVRFPVDERHVLSCGVRAGAWLAPVVRPRVPVPFRRATL